MSRVLKVSQGDYVLQVQSGGNIVLNTGVSTGTVTITGNLDVKGTTTTVESTDTTIKDNIIRLNYGQTGDGISSALGYESGIEIERGTRDAAQIVFYEQLDHYDTDASDFIDGTFRFLTKNSLGGVALSGIQVRTIVNDGNADLAFDLRNSDPVLKIVNSVDYESRVVDDDHIPNKKYVSDYVSATGGVANVTNIHYPLVGPVVSMAEATATSLDFSIASTLRVQITSNGLKVDNKLRLENNEVTTSGVEDLVLSAASNFIKVDGILELTNQTNTIPNPIPPTAVSGLTKVYTQASEGAGRTGIYFVNDTTYGANPYNSDELVSKNRAVLLSILL